MSRIGTIRTVLGIVAILVLATAFFMYAPVFTEDGVQFSPLVAYAFGSSGDGGCCSGSDRDNDRDSDNDDVCRNISGKQSRVPSGYTRSGSNCFPKTPPDVCPNIAGSQSSIPAGYEKVGGNCVPKIVPKPVCTLSAFPTTIYQEQSSKLTWTTTNATSASINQGIGSVALNGSKNVSPNATITYTLTATGPGGTVTCKTTITVKPPVPDKPVCDISAHPTQIQKGNSSTLTWTSSNGTSASINQGIGSVSLNGSRSVTPNQTTTYTLTVTGPGGTVNCSTKIIVIELIPDEPFCEIFANPTTVNSGGSSTLTWNSANATSASINRGIGSVPVDGSRVVQNIFSPTTYTLTVTGPGGTVQCHVKIFVSEIQENPSCVINANPTSIQTGGSSTLTWSSSNAISATLSTIGSVGLNSNYIVYPYTTTTYTLTVYSASGQSAQCQTTIYVNQIPYNNPPSCWITLSHQGGYGYQDAILSWGSNNATSAYINPNIGSVPTSGSRTVSLYNQSQQYGYGHTVYSMTVYGTGGTATCHTQSYTPPVPPPPVITLTQIPYTGIDAGTVGMALSVLSIVVFGAAAMYLAIYYIPAFRGVKARIPEEIMEAPMVFAKTAMAPLAYAGVSQASAWTPKDSMSFARSEDGKSTPRIVITRN